MRSKCLCDKVPCVKRMWQAHTPDFNGGKSSSLLSYAFLLVVVHFYRCMLCRSSYLIAFSLSLAQFKVPIFQPQSVSLLNYHRTGQSIPPVYTSGLFVVEPETEFFSKPFAELYPLSSFTPVTVRSLGGSGTYTTAVGQGHMPGFSTNFIFVRGNKPLREPPVSRINYYSKLDYTTRTSNDIERVWMIFEHKRKQ